jgi:hypothetical protein
VAPWLTGWSVQVTGSFFAAFAVAAGMAIASALSYTFIVGDIKPVDWKKTSD